ncbi:hypothetical protein MTBSS4_740004 [Magnetospirillum sp. SS-4]|nr:hypothetical protein MTBSS4_740004 [Magnetospirillum sp. SS-4]
MTLTTMQNHVLNVEEYFTSYL